MTEMSLRRRGECLALAKQGCVSCLGLGIKVGRAGQVDACKCVLRAIFRACFARFRQCASKEKYLSRVSMESNAGRQRKSAWGYRNEEYMADFCLLAERTLGSGSLAMKVFRYHMLLGADWKLCCRKLKLDRGNFFHEVYRIEEALGRAFRDTQPYGLFPVDEYFGGASRPCPAGAHATSAA
jgi:hypothetical protein